MELYGAAGTPKPVPNFADGAIAQFSHPSSRVQGLRTNISKNWTNFQWIGSWPHGANAEIRVPSVAVAGDDAAIDAGDQAAAIVESRPVGFRRGGTGAQSAAGSRQRRPRSPGGGRAGRRTRRIRRFRQLRRGRRRGTLRYGRGLIRRRLRAGPGGVAEPRPRQPHRDRADAGHPARQRLFRRTRRSRRPRGAGCGTDRLHRMGRRRLQRRRLQSGSLRRRRGDAWRPPRRTARGGLQWAGAAHDRAVSDRSGRRCRLSAGGSGAGRGAAGRLASGCRRGADRAAEVRSARRLRPEFERVPRNPAPRTQPLRPRDAGAGGKSRSAGQARHRARCANCAASTTKISPT